MFVQKPGLTLPRRSAAVLGIAGLFLTGCGPVIEKAAPRPESSRAMLAMNVPQIIRGTITAETVIMGYAEANTPGYRPVVAQGYGLVVGLNGTGSRDVGPDLRAHMLSEMMRGGIGSEGTGWGHLSPQALLDSMDTAVVLVQGIIPLASTRGTRFDVRVQPILNTSTTSLEGGRLYTTDLFPRLMTGRRPGNSFALAQAKGVIFINPFVEPEDVNSSSIDRRNGRILNGGIVQKDMPIKLRLINPSHARAGMLVTAINTRFPQERGQPNPTARGESDESIEITIPHSFNNDIDEFIKLLQHTTIRQANPESVAMSVLRILQLNPTQEIAEAASYRWRALGTRSLPILRKLYDVPDERPRFAAILAGAMLNDPLAIPHLIEMATSSSPGNRFKAIRLMDKMELNPRIEMALRSLLNDDNPNVRIEAYEALARRRDPTIEHVLVDDKFLVDLIDSEKPMIYVTQIGLPRIAIFGRDLSIDLPVTMRTWSNRLMIKSEHGSDEVEVYYRPVDAIEGYITWVDPRLGEFLQFLGHTTTVEKPEPGLGLSYGEVVGALHQIWRQKYIQADFKAEQDRILAAILIQLEEATTVERPEFEELPTPEKPPTGLESSSGKLPDDAARPVTSPGRHSP